MKHGGARKGAGRRPQFGCKTKPMRIPDALIASVQKLILHKGYQLPLYDTKVQAGPPSPADTCAETSFNLHESLVPHPAQTFLVRASGDSMINAGIHENDLLIVDRSIQPVDGKIVIASVDGHLTVKRLHRNPDGQFTLIPENPRHKPLTISAESHVHIWGVVLHVIHSV
ncbi:LexA repressor [Aquicella siphonis]|uniref:LexA repressor n=1 Tax=Aquicella siphonis TaxID=254247 RepID=A0A5E4PGM0_9COXI|nr:translesion error-prone DNA polymerase V autoproteolytic subunit [Aquicella siphonis]VVC75607.1 LexA repressor [Aquicella siphonis]